MSNIMEVNVEPSISIPTRSEVICVEFSPFEWSQNLVAVVMPNAISIYSLKLEVCNIIISCLIFYDLFIILYSKPDT